jgi:hypothetical protein
VTDPIEYCHVCPYRVAANAVPPADVVDIGGLPFVKGVDFEVESKSVRKPRLTQKIDYYKAGKNVPIDIRVKDIHMQYLLILSEKQMCRETRVISAVLTDWFNCSPTLTPNLDLLMACISRLKGQKRGTRVNVTIPNRVFGFLLAQAERIQCKESELARAVLVEWLRMKGVE